MNCIKRIIQTHKQKIDAEELKSTVRLKRNDKIGICHLPKVEQYIKEKTRLDYAIHVSGGAEYISSIQTNKIIRLILSNGHFTIDETNMSKKKRIAYEEKKIIMCEFHEGEFKCYDREKYFTMSKEEHDEIDNNPISSDYFIINRKDVPKPKDIKKLDLKQAYDIYIEIAEEMKQATEGRINFYKCG